MQSAWPPRARQSSDARSRAAGDRGERRRGRGRGRAPAAPASSCSSGVAEGDGSESADRLARKIARLRVFEDERGRFDRSLSDVGGEALVVSQFTLLADSRRQKGTRPDFSKAARPEVAAPLIERFCEALRGRSASASRTGRFGAYMQVALVNDGPVTIVLDVEPRPS